MSCRAIPERAVILAAGFGSRLRPYTDYRPKPLVEVNGVSILHNALTHLDAIGVCETVIVVGYRKDAIEYACGDRHAGMAIRYVESSDYATTGSARSLWLARDMLLAGDVLLLEGDVFFERAALERLLAQDAADVAAVAPFTKVMEGSAVLLDASDMIVDVRMRQSVANLNAAGPALYKTMNLFRFSARTLAETIVPALDAHADAGRGNIYTEQVLAELIVQGLPIRAANCGDLRWWEIDTVEDLRIAEAMFGGDRVTVPAEGGVS